MVQIWTDTLGSVDNRAVKRAEYIAIIGFKIGYINIFQVNKSQCYLSTNWNNNFSEVSGQFEGKLTWYNY